MSIWFDKKIVGSALIILLVLGVGLAVWQYALAPQLGITTPAPGGMTPGGGTVAPGATTYSQGLTASFKILDTTTSSLVTTGNAVFYSTSDDPFALVSTATPVGFGAYDAVSGAWIAAGLNAGTYNVVIYDGTSVYPLKTSVTVPPATTTDLEVNLNPYMLTVTERSTPTIVGSIAKYESATGLYNSTTNGMTPITAITSTGIDDRWQITYIVSAPGLYSVVESGRLYVTALTGFSVTGVTVNGQPVSLSVDSDASDDGLTGLYIAYPDMPGGSNAMIQITMQRTSATVSAGTFTATIIEQYENHNPLLRYWSDVSTDITVDAYP